MDGSKPIGCMVHGSLHGSLPTDLRSSRSRHYTAAGLSIELYTIQCKLYIYTNSAKPFQIKDFLGTNNYFKRLKMFLKKSRKIMFYQPISSIVTVTVTVNINNLSTIVNYK